MAPKEVDQSRGMPMLRDAPRQIPIEVGIAPDVVDDQDRAPAKTGRRFSQELPQRGAVAGGDA